MVKVDKTKCIGCGSCEAVCSEIFKIKDDEKAHVISSKNSKCLKEAIDICPVDAISK
ncbi:MAG: ferredoxin [Nanoarchaeota archaeon]|nr:ferredoxin [Nanoarchaeota archaeon]